MFEAGCILAPFIIFFYILQILFRQCYFVSLEQLSLYTFYCINIFNIILLVITIYNNCNSNKHGVERKHTGFLKVWWGYNYNFQFDNFLTVYKILQLNQFYTIFKKSIT